jgi:hypothetical protein
MIRFSSMAAKYYTEALLGERLLREAGWKGQDAYPSDAVWYAELEGLLAFVQAHNRLASFWPRLTTERTQERDDALQEIRIARFLTSNGFPIAQWEPLGNGNFIGEFSVQALPAAPVFVEIKSPGWDGELTPEERASGRAKQDKYLDLEGRAVGPAQKIRMSVRKAYPKFLPSQPNLLVIADDLFVPLVNWGHVPVQQALFHTSTILEGEQGYFVTPRFENLGGVALFKVELSGKGLHYDFALYQNPLARPETSLPKTFVDTFQQTRTAHP